MNQSDRNRRPTLPSILLDEPHLGSLSQSQLVEIIASLVFKSRNLIQTLQTALKKLELSLQQTRFWKDRYYKFKQSCELYTEPECIKEFSSETFRSERQVNMLREQNESLKTEIESLRHITSRLSPRFGEDKNYQSYISGVHQTSFGKDSNYKTESPSQQSTDRYGEETEKRGPIHVSRFKFSNKKPELQRQ